MRTKTIAILMTAVCAAMLLSVKAGELRAQSGSALTGVVTSAEDGPMEGVVVSAKASGSTITISVVTDDRGRYAFPATKLPHNFFEIGRPANEYVLGRIPEFRAQTLRFR